ncbi:MAG: hypothetical protein GY679_01640 [Mycoplasma sp.]|nr:hypothetical protein [Mycoplasma sp.]
MNKHKEFKKFSNEIDTLAVKAKEGDKTALAELCRRTERYLCYCIKRCRYRTTKDNLQVAYVSMIESLKDYIPGKSFLYFLRFRLSRELAFNNSKEKGLKKTIITHNQHSKRANPRNKAAMENFVFPVRLDRKITGTELTRLDILKSRNEIDKEISYNFLISNIKRLSKEMLKENEKEIIDGCLLDGDTITEYAGKMNKSRQLMSARLIRAKEKIAIGLKAYGYKEYVWLQWE